MRRSLSMTGLVQPVLWGLLALVFIMPAPSAASRLDESWRRNLDTAKVDAARRERPLLVYFYSDNVRPCREFELDVLTNSEFLTPLRSYTLVAIDWENNRELARSHGLFKVPTVLFLTPGGDEIDRAIGYKSPGEFHQYLDRLEEAAQQVHVRDQSFEDGAVDIDSPGEDTAPITLRFNAPAANTVHLVGDFNDWRTEATPMQRSPTGVWMSTIHLREGVYEYMFLVNGSDYQRDPNNPLAKNNPYGGMNSVLIVGNPKVSPIIQGNRVTFILYRPEASRIEVAGSFNDWTNQLMFRNPEDMHMWGVAYELPPGIYNYKYIIDGEWTIDPENYLIQEDEQGNQNSTFVIRR